MLGGECATGHETARTPTAESCLWKNKIASSDSMEAILYKYTLFPLIFLACQISVFVYRILEPSFVIDIEDSKTLSDIGDLLG